MALAYQAGTLAVFKKSWDFSGSSTEK